MGIFSKSIPQYVPSRDFRNEVEVVQPEDVYVDDIFDPILNARVKDAMRQKYGDGLYGIVGGYSDLLRNTWVDGGDGILGKGMGFLSTFGRSMDKAGDIVLGGITEGVKAATFQGFENPLKNIFVEDENYTGRRLLAAAANSMRGLAGGTTVTEDDFGTVWGAPAMGLELITDPGIGGGVLKKAAKIPGDAYKHVTSKELLNQLTTADASKAGVIGELLSRYDDLTAKVATDITAPGLRPALKALKNSIAKYIPTRVHDDYVNVKRTRDGATGALPPAGSGKADTMPAGPTTKTDLSEAQAVEELKAMADDLAKAEASIPLTAEEVALREARSPSQVIEDVVADSDYNNLKASVPTPEDINTTEVLRKFNDELANVSLALDKIDAEPVKGGWNQRLGEAVQEAYNRAQERGIKPDQLGVDGRYNLDLLGTTDREALASKLNSIRSDIERDLLKSYANVPVQDIPKPESTQQMWSKLYDMYLRPYPHTLHDLKPYNKALEAAKAAGKEEEFLQGKWKPDTHWYDIPIPEPFTESTINKRFVDELREVMADPERFEEALVSGNFVDDDTTNNAILRYLGERRWEAIPRYLKHSRKFNLQPSRMSKLAEPGVMKGVNASRTLIDATRYSGNLNNAPMFTTAEEFDKLFNSDEMFTAFTMMFPPKELDAHVKLNRTYRGLKEFDNADTRAAYNTFKKKLKQMYFPTKGDKYSAIDYVRDVEDVLEFLESNPAIADADRLARLKKFIDEHGSESTWADEAYAKYSMDVLTGRASVPSETKFLTNLYDTLDTVNQKVIQPLNSKAPKALSRNNLIDIPDGVLGTGGGSLDVYGNPTGKALNIPPEGFSIQKEAKYSGSLTDDYSSSYENYAEELFANLGQYVKDQDTLDYIYEPLKPYMELTLGKYYEDLPYKDRWLAGRLDLNNSQARASYTRFYTEVLPLVEEIIAKGGNPFAKFKPKEMSWPNYRKLKGYLGLTAKVGDDPKFTEVEFDKEASLFRHILSQSTASDSAKALKFEPAYTGLGDSLNAQDAGKAYPYIGSHMRVQSPKQLLENIKAHPDRDNRLLTEAIQAAKEGYYGVKVPDTWFLNYPEFDDDDLEILIGLKDAGVPLSREALQMIEDAKYYAAFQNAEFSDAVKIYKDRVKDLESRLTNIGIGSTDELEQLLAKVNSGKPLTSLERRKFDAYSIEYAKTLRSLPVHTIVQRPGEISAKHGSAAVLGAFNTTLSKLKSEKAFDAVDGVQELYEKYLDNVRTNWYSKGYDIPYNFPEESFKQLKYYKQDIDYAIKRGAEANYLDMVDSSLADEASERLNSVWKEVSSKNTYIPEFLRNYDAAFKADSVAIAQESAVAEYAAKRGKRYVENPRVYEHRLNFLKKYTDMPVRKFEAAYLPRLRAASDAVEVENRHLVNRAMELKYTGPKIHSYTPEELKLFEENVLPNIPNKYRELWSPNSTDGLFNFKDPDLTNPPKVVSFGELYNIQPSSFIIQARTGKPLTDIAKYNADLSMYGTASGKYPIYADAIDYTKLMGAGADSTIRDVAKYQMHMDLFEMPTMEFKSVDSVVDDYRKTVPTVKSADSFAGDMQEAIVQQPVEEFVKELETPPSTAAAKVDNLCEELAPKAYEAFKTGDAVLADQVPKEEWDWFEKIRDASAIRIRNANGDPATLRTSKNKALLHRAESLTTRRTAKDFKRYQILTSKAKGDVLRKEDFWNSFRHTSEFVVAYPKNSPMIEATRKSMKHNADILNSVLGGDDVEVNVFNLTNGNVGVSMRWKDNGAAKNDLIVRISKKATELERAKYVDMVFEAPQALTAAEKKFLEHPDMIEYGQILADTQLSAAEQAKHLGFKYDVDPTYSKHVMRRDHRTAQMLNVDIYGGDLAGNGRAEFLDDVSYKISSLDRYRKDDFGVFGTTSPDRRIRGNYWQLELKDSPLFYYDPLHVVKGTLSEGIFANSQYQAFTDVYVNDNFKINGWFKTTDDLKEFFNASRANLQNAELMSYTMDESGRIKKLVKYDKYTNKGLQQALNDPNTVLVPTSAITHMDKLLRKDIRMKNKFWMFVNKHFTIPFKFGLLTNPGFLVGNVSDSVLKAATTNSQKYGTSLASEAKNISSAISDVIRLRNSYSDTFSEFLKDVDEYGIKIAPEARIPEIVAQSPKHRKLFEDWLSGTLQYSTKVVVDGKPKTVLEYVPVRIDNRRINEARTVLLLNNLQLNSSKIREYEDLAGLSHKSNLDMPKNIVDRVTQGSGKYDPKKPSTWGVYLNNPLVNGMTNTSESWEDLIRTASILDDLKHKRYSEDVFSDFYSGRLKGDAYTKVAVDLENAKNAMYTSQFDYEQLSDTLDGISNIVPFPIFFLKNFTYWMDLFEKNPDWVDNAIDIQEGLWGGRDDEDEFAKQAKGRGAVPIGGDGLPGFFKGYFKPTPQQSMYGAFGLLNAPASNLGYRLHPVSSAALNTFNRVAPNELTTSLKNPEEVKYRPYSFDPYEKNVKSTDSEYSPIAAAIHGANPFERQLGTHMRTIPKVVNGTAQMSDFLPSVFQPDYSKK